jgi:hypothetical protein
METSSPFRSLLLSLLLILYFSGARLRMNSGMKREAGVCLGWKQYDVDGIPFWVEGCRSGKIKMRAVSGYERWWGCT